MDNGQWTMDKAGKEATNARSRRSPMCHPKAFTLIEMLTVIVIIVLVIGLSLPVFHSLSGDRSQAGATNEIAAMIGRARSEAIAAQQPRGIAFYVDSNSTQTAMALVQPEVTSTMAMWTKGVAYDKGTYVQYTQKTPYGITIQYLVAKQDVLAGNTDMTPPAAFWYPADINVVDQLPDTGAQLLPIGIGAQLINDWGLASVGAGGKATAAAPSTDSYVSTGVIMFDGTGRLISTPVSITQQGVIGSAMNMAAIGTGDFPSWTSNASAPPAAAPLYTNSYDQLNSAFGLVIYDGDAFTAQNFDNIDPTYEPAISPKSGVYKTGTPSEQTEEMWLDQNATPLLINRYNGTVIRAE